MKKMLVTGGTVFVSRAIAEYFVAAGWEVYVLNRNSRQQSPGVRLIEADRRKIGNKLRDLHFDAVVDTAYCADEVQSLLKALCSYDDYVLISSSAVYPEYAPQPFPESCIPGENKFWGKYGTDKADAERTLLDCVPGAYILRPPYLYGPLNNVYREAFVFDCAMGDRKFFLPGDGSMKLQFFHIHDLCRFIDLLVSTHPQQHVFNVGNRDGIRVRDWVEMCYEAAGKKADFVHVDCGISQRNYFSFYPYEYMLDVSAQYELMKDVLPLKNGLEQSFEWYRHNREEVNRKPFIEYIEANLNQQKR